MTLFFIVRKSLRQHALSTVITVLSIALAAGLMMSVFSLSKQSEQAFTGGAFGFDAVLGTRSSKLALVLNAVFHLDASPGNLPWSHYVDIKKDRRVKYAFPYATGDNYYGVRIVGTVRELFTDYETPNGRRYEVLGEVFDDDKREALIGSAAAHRLKLTIGSTFQPYHGLDFNPGMKHDEEYVIVGILKPTQTPADMVIWIPIDGVFRMEGHELWGTGEKFTAHNAPEIPDEHKEVSAVMIQFKNRLQGLNVARSINRQAKDRTLAFPISESVAQLFNRLGLVTRVLEYVAYLVVVVAAASILASIYNTMNERRREFAIMRALGARRSTVFSVIVVESGTIALIGSAFGYLIYAGVFSATAWFVWQKTGLSLDLDLSHPVFWMTPIGLTLVGALAGLIPAFKAYSTNVADSLVPTS